MRSCYIFGPDPSRRDLQSQVDDDLAGFDRTPLRRGERVDGIPSKLRFIVSNKKQTDLVGNAFGWKIMSERALAIVKKHVSDSDLQILPLPVFNEQTKAPIQGYYLLNCLRLMNVLAFERGDGPLYANLVVIREGSIPFDVHMFRLAEWPQHWIISDQLWKQLSMLDGFDANEVKTA